MIKTKKYLSILLFQTMVVFFFTPSLVASTVATVEVNVGLGITVAQLYDSKRRDRRGRVVVLDLLNEGPAALSGLQRGDIITHIDGKATKGRNLKKVISNLLKGPPGTTVELKIFRTDPARLINIEATR